VFATRSLPAETIVVDTTDNDGTITAIFADAFDGYCIGPTVKLRFAGSTAASGCSD